MGIVRDICTENKGSGTYFIFFAIFFWLLFLIYYLLVLHECYYY
jgi:hypothetical protein